jgi:molybdate transport system substrate-binding protein
MTPKRTRPAPLAVAAATAALLSACGTGDDRPEVLVYAAESLRDVIHEIGAAYEAETGVRVRANVGGSNFLAHQIIAAPGADVYLSASDRWMDEVEAAGRVVPGTRVNLLGNRLVVTANANGPLAIATPCDLATLPFAHLSVGDPEAVPAGIYARQWLRSVECDGRPLWEALQARVAPAPDVRAAMGVVLARHDVIGIVYRTDQLQYADRTRVLYEVDNGPPIVYVLARIAGGSGREEDAAALHAYLTGPAAAAAFARHGFVVLPAGAPEAR